MTMIGVELARRASIVGGKAWGADKQKPRIYMDAGRKDVSAYFSFPDARYENETAEWDQFTGLGGARLNVYIDDSGQKPEWYNAEKAKVRERFRGVALALMCLDRDNEELAKQFVDCGAIEEEQFEQLHRLVSEGKLEDARAMLTVEPF